MSITGLTQSLLWYHRNSSRVQLQWSVEVKRHFGTHPLCWKRDL